MVEKKKSVKREVRKAMGKTPAKPRAQSSKSTKNSKNAQDVVPEAEVQFGREICGEIGTAESREWLVTNGIGGFASGTAAGSMTRRYHGLLIADLQPPVGRTQLLATLDEIVHYAGLGYSLATHRWARLR